MRSFLITMQHNETRMLPIFLSHYARHFEASNIFVVDHGSDANLVPAGVNRLYLPRDRPFSEISRRNAISHFAAGLLEYYDYGVYADADELVDLDRFDPGLLGQASAVYVAGFNVFSAARNGATRTYGVFDPVLCKPLIFSKVPRWGVGFHGCDVGPLERLAVPMAHLKFAFPSAYAEIRAARRTVHAQMNAEEKRHGIASHWGAEGLYEAFARSSAAILNSVAEVAGFSPLPSAGLFGVQQGLHLARPTAPRFLVDLTVNFPSLLREPMPVPPAGGAALNAACDRGLQ